MDRFLESVANVEFYDPTTNVLLGTGYANNTSAFNISMDGTDVRAGQGHQLLYVYKYGRGIEVTVEKATFGKEFLAFNTGATIATATRDVYESECMTLDASGIGTLSSTPVGSVFVQDDAGTIATTTPVGDVITVAGFASEQVTVYYSTSTTLVPRITISAAETPDVVKVVLRAIVKNKAGAQVEELQIVIPNLQISGDYELSLTSDGVSSESITGMALSTEADDCSGNIYGYFDYVPVSGTTTYYAIYASPDAISSGVTSTAQITVYGLRGGATAAVVLTEDCTYAMAAGSDTDITVSDTAGTKGLVTIAGTATAADEGVVDITYTSGSNTLTETVHVVVSA